MSAQELEQFMYEWADEAVRHLLAGDQLRVQQNENYWRRMLLAHVPDAGQRAALTLARRAIVQQKLDERGAA